MNKVIQELEKHTITNDLLFDCYGIQSSEYYALTIISPAWGIEKIIDKSQFDYIKISETQDIIAHVIDVLGKKILHITLKIGAPNMADFCLACYKLNCDNFIFMGSVGGIDKSFNIGEIIVPTTAISANGATLLFHEQINNRNFFENINVSIKLKNTIKNACFKNEIEFKEGKVISVDSLFAEYAHLDEFKSMGAKVIEMEFATFLKVMESIGKNAAGVLVVSDNSAQGAHMFGRTAEQKRQYHDNRFKLGQILVDLL